MCKDDKMLIPEKELLDRLLKCFFRDGENLDWMYQSYIPLKEVDEKLHEDLIDYLNTKETKAV